MYTHIYRNVNKSSKYYCPTLGISPVSWVRLQTYKLTYTNSQTRNKLSVDHTNICSVRESNLRYTAAAANRSATAPTVFLDHNIL